MNNSTGETRLSKNYLKVGVHRCKHQDCTPWGLACLFHPSLPPPLPPPLSPPLSPSLPPPHLHLIHSIPQDFKLPSSQKIVQTMGWPSAQCIGTNVLPSEHNLTLTSSFTLCLFCLSLALWHMAAHDLFQIRNHVNGNCQFDQVSHCICATGMNGLVMLDLDFLTAHRAFLYV